MTRLKPVAVASLAVLVLAATVTSGRSDEPWTIAVMADPHYGLNFYARKTANKSLTAKSEEDRAAARDIWRDHLDIVRSTIDPLVVMMPGDLVNGNWDDQKFLDLFAINGKRKSIRLGAANAYGPYMEGFREKGYEHVFVAVGDHEVGDNPWLFTPDRNDSGDLLPVFRKHFVRHLRDLNRGATPNVRYFSKPAAGPAQRTATAAVIRNVAIITLDQFYADPDGRNFTPINGVVGKLDDDQFRWLRSVLRDVRDMEDVDWIIAQGHLPILTPVRMIRTSGLTFHRGTRSRLARLFRRFRVHAYLAGEVHDTTAVSWVGARLLQVTTKAGVGDLVSKSPRFTSIKVRPRRLVFKERRVRDGVLQTVGKLVLKRRGRVARSSGSLKQVYTDSTPISYDFTTPPTGCIVANTGAFAPTHDGALVGGTDADCDARFAPDGVSLGEDFFLAGEFGTDWPGPKIEHGFQYDLHIGTVRPGSEGTYRLVHAGAVANAKAFWIGISEGRLVVHHRGKVIGQSGPLPLSETGETHVRIGRAPYKPLKKMTVCVNGSTVPIDWAGRHGRMIKRLTARVRIGAGDDPFRLSRFALRQIDSGRAARSLCSD